ncbi:MAG TPA: hypothetical protein VE779_17145, partial [Candidatus Angelobacter sp.]|nr:hypothetical protein [Candidatus Angelobacter sp.]
EGRALPSQRRKSFPVWLRMWPVFSDLYDAAKFTQMPIKSASYRAFPLTFLALELGFKYHLRSISGSNGLGTKESSPLFGFRPILFFVPKPKTGARH